MFVEEIVSKRKGKVYKTVLVRESIRLGSAVTHRTLANISHLPQGCVEGIKRYLKGNSLSVDLSKVQVLDSKEYGASRSLLSLVKEHGLDSLIFSRKIKWRETIMVMLVGRLLYPGNELTLTSLSGDTVLWELCGFTSKTDISVCACYNALKQLLAVQKNIQRKSREKYSKSALSILFLTQTIVEEETEWSDFATFRSNNDCIQRYKQYVTLLLTNFEGSPIAVDALPATPDTRFTIQKRIRTLTSELTSNPVVVVGDQHALNSSGLEDFTTITALTKAQMHTLIDKKIILPNLFSADQFYEVSDPHDSSIRYILMVNPGVKKESSRLRNELLKKSVELLQKIQKSNPKNIGTEVEKIWITLNTEKFFAWHIKEGVLCYSLNDARIKQEEQLDGCYVIKTNITKEMLSAAQVVKIKQKLNLVQQSFRIVNTISTHVCDLSLEERVQAHVLLSMLAYSLQLHVNRKLEGNAHAKQWTLSEAIERLKSIREQTLRIGELDITGIKTILDPEQQELVTALGVSSFAKS